MEEKRTVLITGGTRGIGKACVDKFSENGYNIVINYIRSEALARKALDKLLSSGVNADIIETDVSNFYAVERMKARTDKMFKVDTIINNAGVAHVNLFSNESSEDFDECIGQNLKSVFNVSRIYSPDMISRGFGRIINISSIFGQTGGSMEVLYSAAKAGVIGLTKGLSRELAPSGVTVNAVAPGFIDTDMNSNVDLQQREILTENIPVMRLGKAPDVAEAVFFLAKRSSSFITGTVLSVNGGEY